MADSMITLCLLSLVAAVAFGFNDTGSIGKEDLEYLKTLKYDALPGKLQAVLGNSTTGGKSSGWCCTDPLPVKEILHSRTKLDYKTIQTKVRTGYRQCGFWNLKRCSVYEMKSSVQAIYHTEYYLVPEKPKCAEANLKCCPGLHQVAGTCMSIEEMQKYVDTLLYLKNHNVLG